jgi:hypothetical protein
MKTLKHILVGLILGALLLLAAGKTAVAQSPPSLSFVGSAADICAGPVDIFVRVNNIAETDDTPSGSPPVLDGPLQGYTIRLLYPAAAVTAVSTPVNGWFNHALAGSVGTNGCAAGVCSFNYYLQNQGGVITPAVFGSGDVQKITLTSTAADAGTTSLSLKVVLLADSGVGNPETPLLTTRDGVRIPVYNVPVADVPIPSGPTAIDGPLGFGATGAGAAGVWSLPALGLLSITAVGLRRRRLRTARE